MAGPGKEFLFTGTVATDGSCSDPTDERLRRAGCAVVQCGSDKQALRCGSTCPGPGATARAELYALCCAVKFGTPPLLVITDSWVVHKGVKLGVEEMAGRVKSPMVDLWRQLHSLLSSWPERTFQVRWAPSHSERAHEESFVKRLRKARRLGPVEPSWLAANRCADCWAEKARLLDAIPGTERTRVKKIDKLVRSSLLFAAESLEQDLKGPDARRGRKRAHQEGEHRPRINDKLRLGPQSGGHNTWMEGSVWRCGRCDRSWHKATMYARTKSESCPGRPPVENTPRTKRRESVARRRTERWIKRSEGRPVHSLRFAMGRWVCAKCGKFDSHYPAALGQVCSTEPKNVKARKLVEERAAEQ